MPEGNSASPKISELNMLASQQLSPPPQLSASLCHWLLGLSELTRPVEVGGGGVGRIATSYHPGMNLATKKDRTLGAPRAIGDRAVPLGAARGGAVSSLPPPHFPPHSACAVVATTTVLCPPDGAGGMEAQALSQGPCHTRQEVGTSGGPMSALCDTGWGQGRPLGP